MALALSLASAFARRPSAATLAGSGCGSLTGCLRRARQAGRHAGSQSNSRPGAAQPAAGAPHRPRGSAGVLPCGGDGRWGSVWGRPGVPTGGVGGAAHAKEERASGAKIAQIRAHRAARPAAGAPHRPRGSPVSIRCGGDGRGQSSRHPGRAPSARRHGDPGPSGQIRADLSTPSAPTATPSAHDASAHTPPSLGGARAGSKVPSTPCRGGLRRCGARHTAAVGLQGRRLREKVRARGRLNMRFSTVQRGPRRALQPPRGWCVNVGCAGRFAPNLSDTPPCDQALDRRRNLQLGTRTECHPTLQKQLLMYTV